MDPQSNLSRASSRAKRSTTNLAHLRLAPLSTRYADPRPDIPATTSQSPYEEPPDLAFARQHPSYLHGKSAPTTPGILSRNSSRTLLGGGLSRRGSLYDADDVSAAGGAYEYASSGAREASSGTVRVDVGSGRIPKAKSEAALLLGPSHRLAGHGVPVKRKHKAYARSTGRENLPPPPSAGKSRDTGTVREDEDWLTRTGAATSALLQESKGQSWLASRASSTSLARGDSTDDDYRDHDDEDDDEDDDRYEEMAALSATTAKLQLAGRASTASTPGWSKWGSRYGSRSASRRTSRRGSATGLRTPLTGAGGPELAAAPSFFDEDALAPPAEPDFVDPDEAAAQDEEGEVARLADTRSFGLGGFVDRLMGFNLFNVDERDEATEEEEEEDEGEGAGTRGREAETAAEARERMAAETRRKREEKERLVAPPPAAPAASEGAAPAEVGWQDAAWLLSIASKAMF